MKTLITLTLSTCVSLAGLPAQAISPNTSGQMERLTWQAVDAHQSWTQGTIVRVSVERGKLTIDHGMIRNLDMMAMTMPFTVRDPSLLEGLAVGDAIEFVADMDGDELIVTDIRPSAS